MTAVMSRILYTANSLSSLGSRYSALDALSATEFCQHWSNASQGETQPQNNFVEWLTSLLFRWLFGCAVIALMVGRSVGRRAVSHPVSM